MPLVETSETHRRTAGPGRSSRIRDWLVKTFIVPLPSSQGVHIDPLTKDEPNPNLWSKDVRSAWVGEEMKVFRGCLRYGDMDIRRSVLDDLSAYYHMPPEEALRRCLHWEQWSVDEWRAGDRSTREGLQEFYNTVQSWSFDLLWYAYLQASGFGFPASVVAARFARQKCPGGKHLDFGSGIGATSQLFGRLGFETTCADVSKTLLEFAQWRLERHGDRAHAHDLNSGELAKEHYDVVTAIDTLAHVPDFDAAAHMLHRIIRPGGWLLTNFDVRTMGDGGSAWHLYENALDLEVKLQRAGFVRRAKLGGELSCYERVDPGSIAHKLRSFRDKTILESPAGTIIATSRRIRWPTPDRIRRVAARVTKKLRGTAER